MFYQMIDRADRFDARRLQSSLAEHPFVNQVIFRRRLGSTNDLAKRRASEGAPEGLLVVADEQTAGRGRMRRGWWSPPASALLTSLLFRCSFLPPERTQQLSMLCALAAADAVTEKTGLAVAVKWPNDLLLGGRKLAGLLTESAFQGERLDFVVVGMGMNVNTDFTKAPDFITPATSLQWELDASVNRLALLVAYLDGVARRYASLKQGKSPFDEWAGRLVTLGQRVTARRSDETLSGLAEAVDVDGALLLRTADGVIHRMLAADVSLRRD